MARRSGVSEVRDGVELTNLDQPLFQGAGAAKRQFVDYLDGVRDRLLPVLRDRPLSVIRSTGDQAPFMQKNVPKYTPEWVATMALWAEASKRTVTYAPCNDRRTLLWFANQRAIEYHPTLGLADRLDHATHLVLDLDPPGAEDGFGRAVAAALLVRQALADLGLEGAVKTSGAKGVHVFVPITAHASMEDAGGSDSRDRQARRATRSVHGDDGVPQVRSRGQGVRRRHEDRRSHRGRCLQPTARPGVPVSFPLSWDELEHVVPTDFTIETALDRLGDADPWAEAMPSPQRLSADLVAEGHEIPVARVAAMHEGKRRKRAAEKAAEK